MKLDRNVFVVTEEQLSQAEGCSEARGRKRFDLLRKWLQHSLNALLKQYET